MSDPDVIAIPVDRPLRVVTVCLGNICRSPMARSVFTRRLADAGLTHRVEVDSAGTAGWHAGGGADDRAVATLRRHGYGTDHRARQLIRHDLADFDLVLVADRSNLADARDLARTPDEAARIRLLRSFDPDAPDGAEIPDPYYGDGDGFLTVLTMIEAAADGFIARLDTRSRAAD